LTLIRVYPDFEVFEGLTPEDQSWIIAKDYGICNGWRLNFAVDAGGHFAGETNSSADVSTELDRLLLGKLRSLSDLIVTSGKTARLEKYRSSKHAPIAIFTTSGDLDDVPAIQGTQYFTPLVLTPNNRVEAVEQLLSDVDVRVIAFEASGTEDSWPIAIAQAVQGLGYQSPILESGPVTNRNFVSAGVIDEICLSVTHRKTAGVSARNLSTSFLNAVFGSTGDFKLAQLFTDGRTTFSRWVRNGVAAGSLPG
jgi:riboflavin biosynthesis pyrimidine reductase